MNSVRAESGNKNGRKTKGLPSLSTAAQQLGLDESALGEEAKELWNMLNSLSESDPDTYQKVLREQVEQAKEPKSGTIIPVYQFTLRYRNTIRLSDSCSKVVYVNCCSHRAVDPPLEGGGSPVEVGEPESPAPVPQSLSGITIPIAVGLSREIKSEENVLVLAVDILIHPWVYYIIKDNYFFKSQVVDIIQSHVQEDLGVRLGQEWKELNIQGPDAVADPTSKKCGPVPFVIKGNTEHEDDPATQSKTPTNPTELLQLLKRGKEVEENDVNQFASELCISESKEQVVSSKTKSRPLVTEIQEKTSKPKLRKGFLNKTTKPLYPDSGSENGGPKSFWERAKIVNMTESNPDILGGNSEKSNSATTTNENPRRRQDISSVKEHAESQSGAPSSSTIAPEASSTFMKLAETFDDELSKSAVGDGEVHVEETLLQSSMFLEALGALTGESDPAVKRPTDTSRQNVGQILNVAKHDNLDRSCSESGSGVPTHSVEYDFEMLPKSKSGANRFKCLVKLPKVQSWDDVEIEVSDKSARVRAHPWYKLTEIPFPFAVDSSTTAKLRKSSQMLVIKGKSKYSL